MGRVGGAGPEALLGGDRDGGLARPGAQGLSRTVQECRFPPENDIVGMRALDA
jgi:hypothetical protein